MMASFVWIFLVTALGLQSANADWSFDEAVTNLAEADRRLCGRVEPKQHLVMAGKSEKDFVDFFTKFKSNGTEFSCGWTRSWIAELVQGLDDQYVEFKTRYVDKDDTKAGFIDRKADKLIPFFNEKKGSKDRQLYLLQIVHVLDHVWAIEQLAEGKGYRVYQSYNGAYSLKAWLNKDESKFSGMYGKQDKAGLDIIYWQKVYDQTDAFLKSIDPKLSLQDLSKLPPAVAGLKPTLMYIRDYSKDQIIGNLKTAWKDFGAGKILSTADFYSKYLDKLAILTKNISALVNSSTPWSQANADAWIHLFGSPNPLCFVGQPFNLLTAKMSQVFELQIKRVSFGNDDETNDKILDRTKVLLDSVGLPSKGLRSVAQATQPHLVGVLLATVIAIFFRW